MEKTINFEVIYELIRVSKQMEALNLINAYEGNLSVLADGLLYITPAATRKSTLTEDQIAVFDEHDCQIHGTKKASSEKLMHRGAYTVRPDIKAVIHCHSPYLTAYAICNVPLHYTCHPEILLFFKDIPVAPYGQPGTCAMIDTARPYLENRNLILLANHGALAVGSTLEKALQRVEAAEKFAQIITICNRIGPMTDIPPTEVERILGLPIET